MQGGWARYAHLFTKYYQTSELWRPPKLKHREWMFIPFGNRPPIRHQGFSSLESVREFVTRTPSHSCFYSTAYWHKPYERKMADKDWIGADLIFDLDGDHLPGVRDNDFPGMMEKIQEQAYSLWNDFLVPDFGFEERFSQLTFSGHRGFHIHYRDPDLIHLSSDARRELVSHIRGEGVDVQGTLLRSEVGDLNGWQKRLEIGLDDLIDKLILIDSKEDGYRAHLSQLEQGLRSMKERNQLDGAPYSAGSIEKLASSVSEEKRTKELRKKNFNVLPTAPQKKMLEKLLLSDSSVVLGSAGETDEVVTIDTRRQIRWPSSLHGKSGMRVTEFPLSRLDPDKSNKFDAFSEAVVFSRNNSTKIEITADDITFEFYGERKSPSRGDIITVSEAEAIFLTLKKWGKVC